MLGQQRHDSDGELGVGSSSTTPTPPTSPVTSVSSGVALVSLGSTHSCYVRTDLDLRCVGYNAQGGLGRNTSTTSVAPWGNSSNGSPVVEVSAGLVFTLALMADGTVRGAGANGSLGQLGSVPSQTNTSSSLVELAGLADVVALALGSSGSHTLPLREVRKFTAGGRNSGGALGTGDGVDAVLPQLVSLP